MSARQCSKPKRRAKTPAARGRSRCSCRARDESDASDATKAERDQRVRAGRLSSRDVALRPPMEPRTSVACALSLSLSFLSLACGSAPPPAPAPPVAIAGPAAPAATVAPPVDPLDQPMALDARITHGRLPSGLHYYILPHRKPEKRALLWLAVDAGSVLERDEQRGLAHYVEHMAFNGTKRFPKQELVDFFEKSGVRFGADLNASTS